MPVNSLLVFFLIALFFVAMLQVHIFEIAFVKLGLTPEVSVLILNRVEVTGLRPLPLPHHRTCGFPHTAVESNNLCCCEF